MQLRDVDAEVEVTAPERRVEAVGDVLETFPRIALIQEVVQLQLCLDFGNVG